LAVAGVRDSYRAGNCAPLLVVPTGGGKTVIFSYVAGQTSSKAKRVLILVHRIELLRQTAKALRGAGVRHGLINSKYTPDRTAPVQVASVQTLVKRLSQYPADWFDLIVIDEAHHATAGTWLQVVQAFPKARVLGVTATPERADGKGLGADFGGLFDDMIIGPTVAELIALGYLVKPVIYSPPSKADLSEVDTVRGDYDRTQLNDVMDKAAITGDAVVHYRQICAGTPAVVFCVSVAHAQHVAADFRAAGFQFAAVDGSMPDDERQALLNGLGGNSTDAELKVLKRLGFTRIDGITSCDLISEGTDIPAIGCAILLRPTQSLGLFIQQVGRALRPAAGKDFAIILDHVGNVGSWQGNEFVLKHGLPEQDREWSLEGRKKKKGKKRAELPDIKISQCPNCFAVHEPAPTCVQCGHVYVIKSKKPIGKNDGELRIINAEDAVKLAKTKVARMEVGRAHNLADLQALEKARGYKKGWATHVWAAKNKKTLQI
jgi:DNA repair protein RadD